MAADTKIKEMNAKADASLNKDHVRFAHNKLSDWTAEEKAKLNGLMVDEATRNKRELKSKRTQGRNLIDTASAIDWAANGITGPVKDQGSCGSCYTFAANTGLEAMISIKYGSAYQRLSEQHIVDCATTANGYNLYGCDGGYMHPVWEYFKSEGAMDYEDYPYVGYEQSCQENQS